MTKLTDASSLRVGSLDVAKVYAGGALVFPASPGGDGGDGGDGGAQTYQWVEELSLYASGDGSAGSVVSDDLSAIAFESSQAHPYGIVVAKQLGDGSYGSRGSIGSNLNTRALKISHDGAVVAFAEDHSSGGGNWHVRVFAWDGSDYQERVPGAGEFVHTINSLYGDPVPGEHNSFDISGDGSTIALTSALGSYSGSGPRVLRWGVTGWEQVGLVPTVAGTTPSCKALLSYDGNRLVVSDSEYQAGAPGSGSFGYLRVFDWDGTDWQQVFYRQGNGYKEGLDIAGDAALDTLSIYRVNAPGVAPKIGAVRESASGVLELSELTLSGLVLAQGSDALFPEAVSGSGNTVAVRTQQDPGFYQFFDINSPSNSLIGENRPSIRLLWEGSGNQDHTRTYLTRLSHDGQRFAATQYAYTTDPVYGVQSAAVTWIIYHLVAASAPDGSGVNMDNRFRVLTADDTIAITAAVESTTGFWKMVASSGQESAVFGSQWSQYSPYYFNTGTISGLPSGAGKTIEIMSCDSSGAPSGELEYVSLAPSSQAIITADASGCTSLRGFNLSSTLTPYSSWSGYSSLPASLVGVRAVGVAGNGGFYTQWNANYPPNVSEGINVAGQAMTGAALDQLYSDLSSVTNTTRIFVAGNPGTADDDPTIATAKGYTVFGS